MSKDRPDNYPHSFIDQDEANRNAIIQSMMTALGIDAAEAERRLEEEDYRGLNSTEAAREYENESVENQRSVLSIPNQRENDIQGKLTTAPQRDVPQGVTPPQIVVDGNHDEEEKKEQEKRDDRRAKRRNSSK